MMESIFLSFIAFISTNIDDLFINMLFFAQFPSAANTRSIITGKYLGIGALTAISMLGAYGLQTISAQHLSLLGFVPMTLGVREFIRSLRGQDSEDITPPSSQTLWVSMMLITIANGADNIGVYLPLFAEFSFWQMGTAIAVFALMTALWCCLSKRMTDLPVLRGLLAKYKSILIPLVYILLGFYLLL